MHGQITPRQWRLNAKLSLCAAAGLVGVTGRNPARTWQRWERGDTNPPVKIVAKVEELSQGRVKAADWVFIKKPGTRH